MSVLQAIFAILLLLVALYLVFRWRILPYLFQFLRMKIHGILFIKRGWTVPMHFARRVAATPHAPALIFEGRTMSFTQLDALSNRVAHWGLAQGLQRADVVALMMENRPEFIAIWLGLAKLGVVTALLNTHLKGDPLLHSLEVSQARLVVCGTEAATVVSALLQRLPRVGLWELPATPQDTASVPGFADLAVALSSHSGTAPVLPQRLTVGPQDPMLYIYTSGTTGLPKAATIKHSRFFMAGASFANFFRVTARDRIYCPLPVYHSAGGMVAVSLAFYCGCSVVLRRKFSASAVFRECRESGATVLQYIGELAGYLLATPPSEDDRKHSVTKAIGNGMRPQCWKAFQQRFGIREVCEFYGSTEGNCTLVNNQNRAGAVGWIPWEARFVYPVALVKFDLQAQQPVRDTRGRCVEVETDEPGELIGKIVKGDPLREFEGYTNASATQDKVLCNVFRSGDQWFRTGDLLRRDREGFLYFVDRVGDTFRWKGENVATSEVAKVLQQFPGIQEVTVYGVEVAGHPGRAGMAAIVLAEQPQAEHKQPLNFQGLYHHVSKHLSSFQQPLFLRLQKQMEITSTFKHRKVELVREGFCPSAIADPLYFRDDTARTFVPLDTELYTAVTHGARKI